MNILFRANNIIGTSQEIHSSDNIPKNSKIAIDKIIEETIETKKGENFLFSFFIFNKNGCIKNIFINPYKKQSFSITISLPITYSDLGKIKIVKKKIASIMGTIIKLKCVSLSIPFKDKSVDKTNKRIDKIGIFVGNPNNEKAKLSVAPSIDAIINRFKE